MDFITFWTICSANGIILEKDQIDIFKRYYKEILYWNKNVNLISRKDSENLLDRHFLHSLSILKYVEVSGRSRCLDIGTGGGFPGIPLKIAKPSLHMLLVDSIAKKIKITDMFAKHTGLRNIEALNIRAEKMAEQEKWVSRFDFVFARAVTDTSRIIDWVDKLLKPGGSIVLLKGGSLEQEISEAKLNHGSFSFEELDIKLFGYDWFEQENKKIIVCKKDS